MYLTMNILTYPLWSSWSSSSSFWGMSNRTYTHISSLELPAHSLKLLRHIYQRIYSYILFGANGPLSQDFETYLIRKILICPLWRSSSTSLSFWDISIKESNHISPLELLVRTNLILIENRWFYDVKHCFSIIIYHLWSSRSTSSSF